MVNIQADQLSMLTREIFVRKGASPGDAAVVSGLLVKANLMGHDSHGVIRIEGYVKAIDEKKLDPRARGVLELDGGATALINGNWGFGQVVATDAMKTAIEKGKKYGVSAVSIYNCGHIGRMADYCLMAEEQGMIGIAMVNSTASVSPFGGVDRIFNPSPIGAAVPSGTERPFMLDISMSVCAQGKIEVKRARGERLPKGWIIDRDGRPSTDPNDFYDGGSILPIGGDVGYKGYGLAFLVDILSGALSGNGCASSPEFRGGNGVFMLTLDIARFAEVGAFKGRMDEVITKVKTSRKAPGISEIMIPGEPEFVMEDARLREGIFIEDSTWRKISDIARSLGIAPPEPGGR
ncbi:MAG: Ldh family oxidoreductase [Thaumarchaeota archaeon]|nr:Ldh family oxidoreductase [Nitrososphaerota archaeon]